MTEPSKKSDEMTKFIDSFSKRMFGGIGRTASIASNICVTCKGPAQVFHDALSLKEYTISGMCQKCQNETFGEDLPPRGDA